MVTYRTGSDPIAISKVKCNYKRRSNLDLTLFPFQFLSNTTKIKTVWGNGHYENVLGVDIIPTFDEKNNFAVLEVPQCDTRIKFRAYDKTQRRQQLLPGVTVMAPNDARVSYYFFAIIQDGRYWSK